MLSAACCVHRRSLHSLELGRGDKMEVKAGDKGENEGEGGRVALNMVKTSCLPDICLWDPPAAAGSL